MTQHWALLQGVAAKLQAAVPARLTGIVADSIRARKVAAFNDFTAKAILPSGFHAKPGILVCFWGSEKIESATNTQDDWTWPVLVAFSSADADLEADNTYYDNRRAVASLFVHQVFSTASPAVNYYDCEVEFGPILDPGWLQQKGDVVGTLGLKFKQRTTRG